MTLCCAARAGPAATQSSARLAELSWAGHSEQSPLTGRRSTAATDRRKSTTDGGTAVDRRDTSGIAMSRY